MEKLKLLIVDDDEDLRMQMRWALMRDYHIFTAQDGQEALAIFKTEHPTVITLDLGLPPHPHGVEEGFRLLNALLQRDACVKVIIITGHEGHEHALEAIGQGAYDFCRKPIRLDELNVIIKRAFHIYQLEYENRLLQQQLNCDAFEGIIGTSHQMQDIFTTIRKVAATETPVLIMGESGTGKELVARAIHRQSQRSGGPFHVINCGAIPADLLESELFGHEKGAFTGAHIQRKGRLELAQRGTLLLDELGDLSLLLQVKLLRFLQERQMERVGGRDTLTLDVRILAATNKDLHTAMHHKMFREDLYYRVSVVSMTLPPLRERGEDILLLANTLLQRYGRESRRKLTGFSRQAIPILQTYHWPGNIRELENRLKRAVIMADGPRITPEDLELASSHASYEGLTLREAREALEKELVQQALSKHQGNVTRTAAALGVSRPTLHDLLAKYNIAR